MRTAGATELGRAPLGTGGRFRFAGLEAGGAYELWLERAAEAGLQRVRLSAVSAGEESLRLSVPR